jgi:hypothetical protein
MPLSAAIRRGFKRAPEYHAGGVLPNLLGYQVARAVSKHALRRLRPRSGDDRLVEDLDREGIVVLHDFLAPSAFEAVRREYEDSRGRLPYRRDFDYASFVPAAWFDEPERLHGSPMAVQDSLRVEAEAFPSMVAHLRDNMRIRSMVAGAARRKVRRSPKAQIVAWRLAQPGEELHRDWERPKARGEYMLHADTHYPTFKAWFYLNDVGERNGAFAFVRRSHRLDMKRLQYEYDASVRVARSRRDGSLAHHPSGHVQGPRGAYQDWLERNAEPICAPANSIVIANTSGFHRRGDFSCSEPRETVHLDWRNLESLASRL